MRALLLSPCPERIHRTLADSGVQYIQTTEHPDKLSGDLSFYDWLISFGYPHILPKNLLDQFPRRAINIHISYLPYNRGADPNFWSWFDQTIKGVTIHQITRGTDTGPILCQHDLPYLKAGGHTLRSTYEVLMRQAAALFHIAWPDIEDGTLEPIPQPKQGTYHRQADKDRWMRNLPGWDASCEEIEHLGQRERERLAA